MAAQPIKYWSTEIDATKSASELMALLVQYGATSTSIEWDGLGQPTGISFKIMDPRRGLLPVRLRARTDAVVELLRRQVQFKRGNRQEWEQGLRARATRIIWRHLRDLVEQQMLAIRIGQYELAEMFMHGVEVQTPDGRKGTLGEWVTTALVSGAVGRVDSGALLLPPAAPEGL